MKGLVVSGALALVRAAGCSSARPHRATAQTPSPIQGGTDDTTHNFAVGVVAQPGAEARARSARAPCSRPTSSRRPATASRSSRRIRSTARARRSARSTRPASSSSPTAPCSTQGGDPVRRSRPDHRPHGHQPGQRLRQRHRAPHPVDATSQLPQYVEPVINPPMTDHSAWATTVTAIGYGDRLADRHAQASPPGRGASRRTSASSASRTTPPSSTATADPAAPGSPHRDRVRVGRRDVRGRLRVERVRPDAIQQRQVGELRRPLARRRELGRHDVLRLHLLALRRLGVAARQRRERRPRRRAATRYRPGRRRAAAVAAGVARAPAGAATTPAPRPGSPTGPCAAPTTSAPRTTACRPTARTSSARGPAGRTTPAVRARAACRVTASRTRRRRRAAPSPAAPWPSQPTPRTPSPGGPQPSSWGRRARPGAASA